MEENEINESAKKGGKWIPAIIIIILFCLVFNGVLIFLEKRDSANELSPERQRIERQSANEYVSAMLGAAAQGGTEALGAYTDTSSLLTPAAQKYALDENKIFATALSNLSWEILMAENTDPDTVKVSVSLTTADMYAHYGNAVHEYTLSRILAPDGTGSEVTLRDVLNSELDSAVHEYTTSKTDITLHRSGSSWSADMTDELADALLGGINNAIESLDINNN